MTPITSTTVTGFANAAAVSNLHAQKAQAAAELIRKDFEKWHTVEELAAMVGLTELQLQTAFKSVYGKTAGVYSREARLQYAHELLEQSDAPLRVVCEQVGYPDPSNFSVAFLRQFGYRPGVIRTASPKSRHPPDLLQSGEGKTEGT